MRYVVAILMCMISSQSSAQASPCGDKRTIDLARKIFTDSITTRATGLPQAAQIAAEIIVRTDISLQSIRTSAVDRSIGKHFCDGNMEIKLSPTAAETMSPYAQTILDQNPNTRGIRVQGNIVRREVRFSSQLTDDKKQQVVELEGHEPLVQIVYQSTAPEAATHVETVAKSKTALPSRDGALGQKLPSSSVANEQKWNASFECNKAATRTELLICSNKDLADADFRLARVYQQALASSTNRDRVRQEQILWLRDRRDTCSDVACMLLAYQDRISEVERSAGEKKDNRTRG